MRYGDLFQRSVKQLNRTTASIDIQLLMEAAFHLTRTQFWIKKNDPITDFTASQRFYRYRRRREKGEPIAYILKRRDFYGETFYVDKRVLVPRPETEILVEQAAELTPQSASVLDIGSGSGIIAIMMAKITGAHVTAIEKSPAAFKVLKKNIAGHNLESQVIPQLGDLFPQKKTQFHTIVTNPPYVPESEWRQLEPGVRDYEPRQALVADNNGLFLIDKIIRNAREYLVQGGWLLIEIGYNQHQQVQRIFKQNGYSNIRIQEDYSRIPRVAIGQWEPQS